MTQQTSLMASLLALPLLLGSCPARAQSNIIPPPIMKIEDRTEKPNEAIENGIETLAKEAPGIVMKGMALHDQSGNAMKRAVDRAGLYSLTVNVFELGAGAVENGREGYVREGGQIVLDRMAGAVADLAVESLVESAVVLSGASFATATGVAGISYAAGAVAGSVLREIPLGPDGKYGPIGGAVDRTAFRIAPDWLKEKVSGTKQVDINSPEFKAAQDSNYDAMRRESAFNRLLGENQQARKAEAQYIALQRAKLDRGYEEQNLPFEQRMIGYQGLDQAAVINASRQITSDLQARQRQLLLAQQQQKKAQQQSSSPPSKSPTPFSAPAPKTGKCGNECVGPGS